MNLGPMALLRCEAAPGVRVVLCCRKVQAADQAMFRHLGVEPAATKILALKSSVHFRADFEPIAEDILVVLAPGPVVALPADLPYVNLRPGVRLGPLGVPFAPRQGA
jgi:microcystin degradation protein MlrC